MNKLPSKKIMFISIVIIAFISSLKFSQKLSAQHFQLKLDWKKEKLIHSYPEGEIDSVSYNYLSIKKINTNKYPNNQNTFSISTENSRRYYFKYINLNSKSDTLEFSAVEWITGIPDQIDGKVLLLESDIPLKQYNGDRIITIGDEMLVKDEAKYFRRKIASEINIDFEGPQKDVFNYKHMADYNTSFTNVNNEMSIPDAEYYVLFWSPNAGEEKNSIHEAKKLIQKLSNKKKTEKIIWINAPKTKNAMQNKLNVQWNQMLSGLDDNKMIIVDAYTLFSEEKKEYLMPDSIHLNKFGYEKLASSTVKLIK